MPFVINPDLYKEEGQPLFPGWEKIPLYLFENYQHQFKFRHEVLKEDYEFDLTAESAPILLKKDLLKNLIWEIIPDTGYYLVVHFICGADFKDLRLAFCVKKKRSGTEVRDLIFKNRIVDPQEITITPEELEIGINYYHARKEHIENLSKLNPVRAYINDREGRAHEITRQMYDVVMNEKTEFEDVRFILDYRGLSLAFFAKDLPLILPPDAIYDHGTGCCPTGR